MVCRNSNIDYRGRLLETINSNMYIEFMNRLRYKIFTYKHKVMEFYIVLN